MNYINTCFNNILHLFYPELCAGCGNDMLAGDQVICLDCMDRLPVTGFCTHKDNPVDKIFRGRLDVVNASAYVYYTKQSVMQQLLHEFKYRGNRDVGLYFGRRIGESLTQSDHYNDIEALVPLPLFPKKEKKRGYNQSAVICEGIAGIMNVPLISDAIARRKNTATQTHKNRIERWENIEGNFELTNGDAIAGRHILLVDDVLTTGATLEACGTELLKAGNTRLSIATIAYTSL